CHFQSLYGGWLVPIQPIMLPPSRRTSAIISPPGRKRSVVSLGCPGTPKWVTRSYLTPSSLTTSLSFQSAGSAETGSVLFAASWASWVFRAAALYEMPYARPSCQVTRQSHSPSVRTRFVGVHSRPSLENATRGCRPSSVLPS